MKTTAVLTRIIPTLSAVRGGGAFNVVIAGMAAPIAEELRLAANDDRLAIAPLLGSIERLAAASEFEPQQAAMAEVLLLADALLGSIADGTAERTDRVVLAVRDLVKRITTDVTSIRDVFSPDATIIRRIRADASELSSLIDAEVIEGIRPGEDAGIAAVIFDQADRLQTRNYDERDAAGAIIAKNIGRLAA